MKNKRFSTPNYKPLTLIELNEFNFEILEHGAKKYGSSNILSLLKGSHSETQCPEVDSTGESLLEPWIQWVSVHNGVEATEHSVRQFCEDEWQPNQQLWCQVKSLGINSSVWNGFNTQPGKAKVYLPIAWSHPQSPIPSSLNPYFQLLQYSATTYTNMNILKLIGLFVKLQWFLMTLSGLRWKFTIDLFHLMIGLVRTPKMFVAAGYLELVGARIWKRYSKSHSCKLNIICIHLMAHLQHNYLADLSKVESDPIWKEGFFWLDRIIGVILDSDSESSATVLLNGMSQVHHKSAGTNNYVYKLLDPRAFLADLGIFPLEIYPHMTAEQTLVFDSKKEQQKAIEILTSAKLNTEAAFVIKEYKGNRLFFRLASHAKIDPNENISFGARQLPFKKYYYNFGVETGSHTPKGVAIARGIDLPEHMQLSEMKNHIVNYFQIQGSNIESSRS